MFFDVAKVGKFYALTDHTGTFVSPGYRDKATVERMARTWTLALFSAAEDYDIRRTAAKAYCAARANRVPYVDPQTSFAF